MILINVPFLYWIHESPHDYYRYTEFAFKKLALRADLKIEVIEVVGGALETWADLTGKVASYIPLLRWFLPWTLFQLVTILRKFHFINKKTAFLDAVFPTGYFVIMRKT